ncbi:phosphopantothenoylcysteine decarboxylase/phosphopantothenate--cysteine ligase [Desulfitispora alkaliphila]
MSKAKSIVVGVTGGIACYKAADLVSSLTKAGMDVHVIMTEAATKFIKPLTFQTLSNNRVIVDMFAEPDYWDVKHISLATKADLFLIAPATANFLGKAANGIADDMLTTTILATKAPIVAVPAMNNNMYLNKMVQDNIQKLKAYGFQFVEPGEGRLACGTVGKGRYPDNEVIINKVEELLNGKPQDMQGKRVLVTAGGTREPIDAVRYITNKSSGKMGYKVAAAAKARGADVTLISAPTSLEPLPGIYTIKVETAAKMHQKCLELFPQSDVIIKAAAVSDFKPNKAAENKIKKEQGLTINLEKNPDILAEMGKMKKNQILVGFAAETEELHKNALKKIHNKNLDLIVANDVSHPQAGFDVDTNIATLFFRDGKKVDLPLLTKAELGERIIEEVSKLLYDGVKGRTN